MQLSHAWPLLFSFLVACSSGLSPSVAPGVGAPRAQARSAGSQGDAEVSSPVGAGLPKLPASFGAAAHVITPDLGGARLGLTAGPATLSATASSPTPSKELEVESCALPDSALPHGFYRTDPFAEGELVLTFDDGPHTVHTPRVLKLLERHRLPATFFLVGRNIRSNSFHLVKRMLEAGHTLGSHTYNHDVKMSFRALGERTVGYIQGQHETTQMLIELALIAHSAEDFEAGYRRVFEADPARTLSGDAMRKDWPKWQANHFALLAERGYPGLSQGDAEARPYPVLYSRPPGGGPYLGAPLGLRQLNDAALARVGYLNVMWHDAAGDTFEGVRDDADLLYGNIMRGARRGGVVLIHDYIKHGALARALDTIATSSSFKVLTMDEAVSRKFGCEAPALRRRMMSAR